MAELGKMSVQAMLCRFAELNDHGLTIIGAGANRVVTSPTRPHRVELALALLVRVPWTTTNKEHLLTIELVSELRGDAVSGTGGAERVPINLGPQRWLPEDSDDRGKIHLNFNVGRPPQLNPGEDSLVPYAIPLHDRELPRPGTYYFSFCVDGTELDRISFQVIAVQVVGLTA